MSMQLYLRGLKANWKIFLIFAAVITMYFTIMVTMFDPGLGSALIEFEKAMPQMIAIVGMSSFGTSLVDFMASYLYGFIMLIFPMVFVIILAYGLVVKKVEGGDITYLLAAPRSREGIISTQICVLVTGIVLFVAYATVLGIVTCEVMFPGDLDIAAFILINLGVLCLHLFIGGICLLASTIFNEAKYALAVGAGIPVLGYLARMIANAGDNLADAKYATFFTLFSPESLIAGESWSYWGICALACGALILFVATIIVFKHKDMHV